MRKYRLMEEGLNKNFENIQDEAKELEKVSRNNIEENERLMELNKNR